MEGTAGSGFGEDNGVEAPWKFSLDDSLAGNECNESNIDCEPHSFVRGDLAPSIAPSLAIVAACLCYPKGDPEGLAGTSTPTTLRWYLFPHFPTYSSSSLLRTLNNPDL